MTTTLLLPPRRNEQLYAPSPLPPWNGAETGFGTRHARSNASVVTGTNRFKYFRKPIIPYMEATADAVLLKPPPAATMQPRAAEPLTRTVGVQTKYRESETQTDPYTPDYIVVPPGRTPEILTLASFTFGHGLPVGMAEIEMIEKARAKRAWEASLPPLDDPTQFAVRQRMMEEMEMQEWKEREAEIAKLQEARLEMLRKMIEKADQENQELNEERVGEVFRQKSDAKEEKLAKIERQRIKVLRKLADKRKNVEGKLPRRDIIIDYTQYGSKVYAPLTRDGSFADKSSHLYDVRYTVDRDSLKALTELEMTLPASLLTARIELPRELRVATPDERKRIKLTQHLAIVDKAIKSQKDTGPKKRQPLKCAKKIEKPPPRPPTPQLEHTDAQEEDMNVAVILLQSLIRGRAVQNMMFEGKERRLPLIQELRTLHAVSDREKEELRLMREEAQEAQRLEEEERKKRTIYDSTMESIQGEVVAQTMDFLAKELVRLREERRVAAMVKLAERERRRREAEETGRRLEEEQRRRVEDEVFRQVMGTHQGSVDSYLESVLSSAIDTTASRQAMEEARLKATKLNTIVDQMESRHDTPETIVRDLVSSFLFPQVERQTLKQQIARDQKRYLMAAQRAVRDTVVDIKDELDKDGMPGPPQ